MKDFDNKLNEFFNTLDTSITKHFPSMVAETATEHFKDSFKSKSWDGAPWQPYKNKAREPRRGSLMMRSNNLFNSIRPSEVTPVKVTISAGNARVQYARIHNEGGLVSGTRQIKPYTNRNFMGKGKNVVIKAHSRTVNYIMPSRRFMGKSQPLLDTIKNRFKTSFKTF